MKHMYDYEPFSKGRMARILFIYELAYRYRRLKVIERGRDTIRQIQKDNNLNTVEILAFIDYVDNHSFKEIRRYLLENGSKIVRRGKKTTVFNDKKRIQKMARKSR